MGCRVGADVNVSVAPSRDDLRLYSLGIARVPRADFERNDAAQIVVHAHAIHDRYAGVARNEEELTSVMLSIQRQQR